ncbi:cytochrome b/b6 domain-containing protein [Aromatoleum anaerobium]|uniref:Cytochrome B n=1 Tax=Aromatoleum anaerobium TaxID=182180 RepID=A0ABX1PU16_9RHOO|nr:cytochrome b/b6 domain-containing protein [Aromatoleum anaerobium]MCK0508694.1 cytochrome b/b6 domain-containing protein [Aromatoleum anaerobium]
MSHSDPARAIRVWDPFVRVFHWTLVSCVFLNFFVIDDGETLHEWTGYAASALVGARIVWGFVGSRHARFADFFPTVSTIRHHLRTLVSGEPDFHAGHNPLGAVMMLALMALVLGLGVTGFMQDLDAFWGEEWLQDLHATLASTLIGLAGLHAAAAVFMSHRERTNLIGAMLTGVKVRSEPNRRR